MWHELFVINDNADNGHLHTALPIKELTAQGEHKSCKTKRQQWQQGKKSYE